MWKPQLDEKGSFGLGFALDEWRGRKTVGHGGAVFGHSTAVTFLPPEKIGVVVLCNEDIVSGRTQRLANLRSALMLEARSERNHRRHLRPPSLAGRGVSRLVGAWESQSFWLELAADGDGLRGDYSQPALPPHPGRSRSLVAAKPHPRRRVGEHWNATRTAQVNGS